MGLISNIPRFFELFKQGEQVTNPATWKNRTIAMNALVGLFGTSAAIAKGFGYSLDLDQDTIQGLAAGVIAVVAVVNGVMHCITSAKVGLPSNTGTGNGST